MKIFDTLTKQDQELETRGKVRIYLCGVTVYDDSHIGHARTIIVFDVLRRYLEAKGAWVDFIQNFTDVDDKIITRAKRENVQASAISSRYIDNYFHDFDELNVLHATQYPKATEHIQDMQNFIKSLVDKGVAYTAKNGVYFSVAKFPEYGKLSKKKIDDLLSGARVEVDESKKDSLDFALWKFSNEDPSWESPWGRGRPGWHIECSAMSIKYLGESFEIHGGGRDLIFPHHENEIAQSEALTSQTFAKIWMHVGMVTIDGEKMSKSLGNIKSVQHVLENWGPNIIRLFCLSGHYSKPIDYSEELLKENLIKWRQVEACYFELILAESNQQQNSGGILVSECKNEFESALENDFNTHEALSAFFKLVKETNRLAADDKLTQNDAKIILEEFEKMTQVLGLKILKIDKQEIDSVNNLIKKREDLRKQKQFEEADKIRKEISDLGIELIDHKTRTTWMRKEPIKAEN